MTATTWIILGAIIVYMGLMIGIGYAVSKKNRTADDFYLGGRKLGPLVTAMSAEASDMSSYLLMGLPGLALAGLIVTNKNFGTGFAEVVWTIIGLAAGTYLNWLLVAKRLRRYSAKVNASTIPDFISNRFGDKSGLLMAVSAVIIILFFVPYTASGFASVGKLFNSLFGMDYHVAMLVGAVIIAAYTVLGGFLAASTTDLIQSIVMTSALVIVVIFGVAHAGGVSAVGDSLAGLEANFSLTGSTGQFGVIPIISTLAWGLGYFGMPHILLRFMAIKDESKLKLSRRIASIWVVISMAVAVLIGVLGFSFVTKSGLLTSEGFDPERIVIYFADAISQISVPAALVAGLIFAGILAAIMSTADSQMLAAASSVSENIVHRFFWVNMSNKAQMLFARGTVLVITVVAVVFAWNPDSSVFRIVSFAWAGFGAAFGPLVLFALFWKRTNKWGAFAGILSGGAMVFLWKYVIAGLHPVLNIYELLPAFLVSSLCIVVVSLLTPAPDKAVTDTFDAVKANQ